MLRIQPSRYERVFCEKGYVVTSSFKKRVKNNCRLDFAAEIDRCISKYPDKISDFFDTYLKVLNTDLGSAKESGGPSNRNFQV